MRVFAIDTSAKVLSVALCENEKLIAGTTLNTGNTHSETLLTVTEEIMGKAGCGVSDVDLFACSNGPGSFTGIRIGVSFIKGLAFGSSKPCIGVSTLEALALNLRDYKGIICPVMDARRSQLYNALFRSDGEKLTRLCGDRLTVVDELASELAAYEEPVYFCGDGYYIASENIHGDYIKSTYPILTYQSAYSVAALALEKFRADGAKTDVDLLPVYLRASQAERELNGKI